MASKKQIEAARSGRQGLTGEQYTALQELVAPADGRCTNDPTDGCPWCFERLRFENGAGVKCCYDCSYQHYGEPAPQPTPAPVAAPEVTLSVAKREWSADVCWELAHRLALYRAEIESATRAKVEAECAQRTAVDAARRDVLAEVERVIEAQPTMQISLNDFRLWLRKE